MFLSNTYKVMKKWGGSLMTAAKEQIRKEGRVGKE
jgi:hypothetical protein